MAFGIRSNFASTSSRAARPAVARGALVEQAFRRLRRLIARRPRDEALEELNDRLLRDIGVIRERDIGLSREAATREADPSFWPR